jgi:SSS family solute:Na+ symporter
MKHLRCWRRWAALLCLLLAGVGGAQAQSLVSLRADPALPPLPAGEAPRAMAGAGERLLVATTEALWMERADGGGWQRSDWPNGADGGRLLGMASDGARAIAWFGTSQAAIGAWAFVPEAAGLRATALPAPPALRDLRLSAGTEALYAFGTDAGGNGALYRLERAEGARWVQIGAPAERRGATSLVASGAQLFATMPAAGGDRLLRWSENTGWRDAGAVPGHVLPGSARALGQAHILYALAQPDGTALPSTFQTVTGAWATLPGARVPGDALPATVPQGVAWITPEGLVQRARISAPDLLLGWLDWTIIAVYLLAMTGIGAYFYLREKRGNTASFFVGGRSIPFWAAGVSLYATNVSSISFIAIPAKAFETNWTYLANNLIGVLGLVFVAIWIVPLLRRLDLMSVFSYLETRFHPGIRMLASAMCIATQVGSRMSIILFLPALAIASITGIDVVWSILMMGVFTIVYTTLGGMKAVIWTDFTQVFVMFGGAIFAIVYVLLQVDGGAPEAVRMALAQDKTHLFDFSFDLTQATVWGFIFLVVFDVVLTFPKDQVLMQRVLSTKSDRDASRSVWTFAAMVIPGGFVFYAIGTALWVFYTQHPERMNPALPLDATFPLFIAAELPAGVTGLIIAGIFAAAMSTLSSIINSVSTLISVDFYEKLAKNPTPQKSVRFAEWTGVVVGLAGIGIAIVLSRFDIRSLFDMSIELLGLLGGGFAGAYTLGMFTRRANAPGVAIGIAASLVLTFAIWTLDIVHPYYYLAISILFCIVIGYVASLFFPPPAQSLAGLTILREPAAPGS